jgi:hypothetical protein
LREILTGLALLLIVAIGAAIIGPRFVDWNDRRAMIEAELSARLGVPVQIDGDLGILLLPTPTLTAQSIKLRDETGTVAVAAKELSVYLAPTALLQGKVKVTEMQLVEPQFLLDLPKRGAGRAGAVQIQPDKLRGYSIDKLSIVRGTIRIVSDQSDDSLVEALNATIVAPSLAGPIRGNGSFTRAGLSPIFRFSTGELTKENLSVDLLVEDVAAGLKLETRGKIQFVEDKDRPARSFAGTVTSSGNLQLDQAGGSTGLPWRSTGNLFLADRKIELKDINFAFGTRPAEVSLKGEAHYDFATDLVEANLSARQLDIDLLFGEGAPRQIAPIDAIGRLQETLQPLMNNIGLRSDEEQNGMNWRIAFQADAIALGADQLRQPQMTMSNIAGQFLVESFAADLPHQARLAFFGREKTQTGLGNGRFALSVPNMERFRSWARFGAIDIPALRSVVLEGEVTWDDMRLAISDSDVSLNDVKWKGKLGWTPPDPVTHPQGLIEIDLTAEDIDLDKLPIDGALGRGTTSMPDFKLNLSAKSIMFQGGQFGGVTLQSERIDQRMTIRALDVADFGGAAISARGELTPQSDTFEARISGKDMRALAQLLQRLAPGMTADWFNSVAPSMAPVDALVSLTSSDAADGNGRNRSLTMEGSFASTKARVSALWRSTVGPGGSPSAPSTLGLSLEGEEGMTLLRQLGVSNKQTSIGPLKLFINLRGSIANGFDIESAFDGSIGRGQLTEGKIVLTAPAYPLTGKLEASVFNLEKLSAATGIDSGFLPAGRSALFKTGLWASSSKILLTDIDATVADSRYQGEVAFNLAKQGKVAGQLRVDKLDLSPMLAIPFGSWPAAKAGEIWAKSPFGPSDPPVLFGDLWIEAAALRMADNVELGDARFVLRFDKDLLHFEHGDARFAGGIIAGDVILRRNAETVQISSRLNLTDLDLNRLAPIGADARISGKVETSAIGFSPANLVASAAGGGTVSIKNIILDNLDPSALDRVAKEGLATFMQNGGAALASQFEQELSTAPLKITRTLLPVSLATGTLRLGPADINQDNVAIQAFASADLKTGQIEGKLTMASKLATADPANRPEAAFTWSGMPGSLKRRTDFGSFTAAITDKAIALEQDRTKVFEEDLRERAMFNRRLKADRAKLQAEAEAELFATRDNAIKREGERIRLHFERIKLEAAARQQREESAQELERETNRAKPRAEQAKEPEKSLGKANAASTRSLKPAELRRQPAANGAAKEKAKPPVSAAPPEGDAPISLSPPAP